MKKLFFSHKNIYETIDPYKIVSFCKNGPSLYIFKNQHHYPIPKKMFIIIRSKKNCSQLQKQTLNNIFD